MKKNWMMVVLVVLAYSISAQDCKFKTNKVDPITGKKILGISLKSTFKMSTGIARNGDEYYIESYAYMGGEQHFELGEGSILDVKLGDGTVLNLVSKASVKPVVMVSGTDTKTITSSYLVQYKLSKEQAQQIETSGIKYIRMHLQADQYFDMEFKEKDTAKSISAVKCLRE